MNSRKSNKTLFHCNPFSRAVSTCLWLSFIMIPSLSILKANSEDHQATILNSESHRTIIPNSHEGYNFCSKEPQNHVIKSKTGKVLRLLPHSLYQILIKGICKTVLTDMDGKIRGAVAPNARSSAFGFQIGNESNSKAKFVSVWEDGQINWIPADCKSQQNGIPGCPRCRNQKAQITMQNLEPLTGEKPVDLFFGYQTNSEGKNEILEASKDYIEDFVNR